MTAQYLFFFLSALALAGAFFVVFNRNPVYNVLALIVTFFAIAGHFLLLSAQFLAAVHIIVYAGAIMVLFLYVIMMLNLNLDAEPNKPLYAKIGATIAGGALMLVLIAALKSSGTMNMEQAAKSKFMTLEQLQAQSEYIGSIENLGQVLYKQYMLPFEVSSILFLAGMVGAVMLGKKEIQ